MSVLIDCLLSNPNSSLDSLNLSLNSFTDSSCIYLSRLISLSSTLQSLNLSSNRISPMGLEFLEQGIPLNLSLCDLNLEDTDIDDHDFNMITLEICKKDNIRHFLCRIELLRLALVYPSLDRLVLSQLLFPLLRWNKSWNS